MKSLPEIIASLQLKKANLIEKYPISSIAVFGSYAREEQTHESDVDILVEFSDSIGFKFIDLADELEDILKMNVDLVSKSGVKQKYFAQIQNDLIYV
jgi:predicted nucleotidyltransferase